jgi:crossover junction endodeoxyribonuclease RuvC
MSVVVAFDPGINGAMAVIKSGVLIAVEDTPIASVGCPFKQMGVAEIRRRLVAHIPDLVVIEGVSSRPNEGHAGAFHFGYGAGQLHGVSVGAGFETRVIAASVWKAAAGAPANKDVCRKIAQERFPAWFNSFSLKKHDGRADAALLAQWAEKYLLPFVIKSSQRKSAA